MFHGLKYSHRQLCNLSGKTPTKKNLDADEGEHDFVVFGPDYIGLIEVKNPSVPPVRTIKTNDSIEESPDNVPGEARNEVKNQSLSQSSTSNSTSKNPIMGALKKASTQFDRGMKILEGISHSTQTEGGAFSAIHVFRLVALPNISKNQANNMELNSPANIDVIYRDDFKDFKSFWVQSKTKQTNLQGKANNFSGNIKTIRNVIMRLFASDKGKVCEKNLSLTECVKEIDRKLRNSEITFRGKNTPPNPSVIETSELNDLPFVVKGINIFKTCLQLNYITTDQQKAFEDNSYPIVITGAVGSGKTLVLLAKAIHLILTQPGTKIFIMTHNNNELVSYPEIFKTAGIAVYERDSGDEIKRAQYRNRWQL